VYKRLVVAGDSFTTGLNKLGKNGEQRITVKPWCEYVAEYLGLALLNLSKDGMGNPGISGSLYKHALNSDDLVIVAWSGLVRSFEYRYGAWDLSLKEHTNHEENLYVSEMAIRATHNFLTKRNIPFIMISAFINPPWVQSENWPEWINNDVGGNNTMLDICLERYLSKENNEKNLERNHTDLKGELSPYLEVCMHPNAAGHKLIADTLINYIMEKQNESQRAVPLG
jgi:hypothetical protein